MASELDIFLRSLPNLDWDHDMADDPAAHWRGYHQVRRARERAIELGPIAKASFDLHYERAATRRLASARAAREVGEIKPVRCKVCNAEPLTCDCYWRRK